MEDIVEDVLDVIEKWKFVNRDDEEKVLEFVRKLLNVKSRLCKEINMLYFDGIIDEKLMKLDMDLERILGKFVEISLKRGYLKVLEEIDEGRSIMENILDFIEYLDKSEMK